MVTPREKKPKTILCVDDDERILSALCRVLHRMPYKVVTAKHGEEALGIIPAIRPNLIILDVHMPQMDGFGVLKWLREHEERDTPVVMLTGDHADETVIRGYTEGGVYYITKPFTNNQVRNIVEYLLEDLPDKRRELLEQQL
jgi:DNA-binding response OmpR family regulator